MGYQIVYNNSTTPISANVGSNQVTDPDYYAGGYGSAGGTPLGGSTGSTNAGTTNGSTSSATSYIPPSSSSSVNQTGTTSITTSGTQAARPNIAPPPPAPDTSQLQGILSKSQRNLQIKQAMHDYDALFAATQAAGFQAAGNAGTTYASRLAGAGINPTSSGVVAAQAKLGVFKQLDDITKEKDNTRLDAINKSQALQAQIAAQIASIKQAYTSTLADYNIRSAGIDLDLNKFNASQGADMFKYTTSRSDSQAQFAAQMAARGLNPDGTPLRSASNMNFDPGYSGNAGPIQGASINGNRMMNDVYVGWPTSWQGPDTTSLGWGTGRTKQKTLGA